MDAFFRNARARNTHVEANLNLSFPAQAEAADLAKLILGPQATAALPHPELDFPAFSRALKGALACEPAVWCPLRKRLLPWINVRKLRKLRKRKPLLSHPALLRAQSSSAACVLS